MPVIAADRRRGRADRGNSPPPATAAGSCGLRPGSARGMTMKTPTGNGRGAARLLYGDSEHDADILYATGLFVPDAFPLILHRSRRIAILRDLEIDRARAAGTLDEVLSWSEASRGAGKGDAGSVIAWALRRYGIRRVRVPERFPLGLARELRRRRIAVETVPDPFFPQRACKNEREIAHIRDAQRAAEAGLRAGLEILRRARIGGNGYLLLDGSRLTSERVRAEINAAVIRRGCIPAHTIVAGGNHGADPHESGHGPLRAHLPIVIDIFPRSDRTGYWGDLTRTVVRGRASERVRRAHALVRRAQLMAFDRIRPGVDGRSIHREIREMFTREGFPTGEHRGRMRGFFHGTGHGVGLEIHEIPRIGPKSARLREGNVVTVEPGLYEHGVGGVRLEDLVVVTRDGCRNLTRAALRLEI